MDKYEHFRQFIAEFIQGPNSEAMIQTLADEQGRLDKLSSN